MVQSPFWVWEVLDSKSFGGELNNEQCWKLAGISKDTFYKYKKELELENTHKKILAG